MQLQVGSLTNHPQTVWPTTIFKDNKDSCASLEDSGPKNGSLGWSCLERLKPALKRQTANVWRNQLLATSLLAHSLVMLSKLPIDKFLVPIRPFHVPMLHRHRHSCLSYKFHYGFLASYSSFHPETFHPVFEAVEARISEWPACPAGPGMLTPIS